MKYVIAIVSPQDLEHILDSLKNIRIDHVMVSTGIDAGLRTGSTEVYRDHVEIKDRTECVKIELAVNDDALNDVLALLKKTKEDSYQDRRIFVFNLTNFIQM